MLITFVPAGGQSLLVKDSNLHKKGEISKDTIHPAAPKSVLSSKVDYDAKDSIRLDAVSRKLYLYGKASVKYQDLTLNAAFITISIDSNIAYACGVQDSGRLTGTPVFHQGADVFYAKTIRYNFKSKKGRINQIKTKEGDGYIFGETVKKDTGNVYYMKDGKYSTCSIGLDSEAHFFIRALRLKVIPNKEVVTGPAWLVVEGVPTPLAIPFGFFPLSTGRQSGIIVPAYGESQEQGFFLQNGGYYFGISDKMDMQLTGDIYSYGSWGLSDVLNYNDRYHYNGSLSLQYALTKLPIPGSPLYSSQGNYMVTWTHTQDPKARPNSSFSANVNAGSSNYNTYNSTDPTVFLQNTMQSNIAYTKNFAGTPFHMSINAEQSENTIAKTVNLSLPELTISADRIFPAKWFEAHPDLNSNKWYNTISFTITTNIQNNINTYDSLLFKPYTLRQMQNGMSTSIPISATLHILKYITLTPAVNINSLGYMQTIRQRWVGTAPQTDTVQGLKFANTYNAAATLTTNVYGTYSLGNSNAVMIRHVLMPSVGFIYQPNYSSANYGFYRNVPVGPEQVSSSALYSIFQNGIYGGPGIGGQGAVNLSLGNKTSMKVKTHTDAGIVYKKINLIDLLSVSTAYNMAADSFKWANILITGNTTLFKKLNVNFSGTVDPYKLNAARTRDTNELVLGSANNFGRLLNADFSLGTSITPSTQQKPASPSGGTSPPSNTGGLQLMAPDQYMYYQMMMPYYYAPLELNSWSLTFFYNLVYSQVTAPGQQAVTQSLTVNGSAQVTRYWYASIFTGYDFVGHQFTATSISCRRDMHCWELEFTTVPFGFHQSFTLSIHVKSSVLQDLKLQRTRDWEDTQMYGQ
ncbi:MAG: LPS-assembly protein LptD [Bacteroidia bacterium]|nr:LPS-assembly protein LptD [Bacteroidia bacterium]